MPASTSAPRQHRVRPPAARTIHGFKGRLRTRVVAAVSVGALLTPFAGSVPLAVATPSAVGPVLHWNAIAGEAAIAACIAPTANPLTESRLYAITHIAIHDALNAINPRFAPYAADLFGPPGTSVDAAVAAAARDVMMSAFNDFPQPFRTPCGAKGAAFVERAYNEAIGRIPAGPAKEEGLALGRRAAVAIIEKREGDRSTGPIRDPGFPQGTEPGQWRFTEGNSVAFGSSWGSVKPFGLSSATQFQSAPPHPLASAAYARDYNEIKRLGGDAVTTPTSRTPGQTETALFWLESSPMSWNRLARTIAGRGRLDLWEQARLFGLLNIAQADGYISSFAQKYAQQSWRPITAIRLGGTDGNNKTTADPGWTPLVTTPPVPDHDSAHAVEGGAASTVFRAVFGTDRFSFAHCSLTVAVGKCDDATPVVRRFTRFSQAAAENSASRIYVGFHFRWATVQGQRHGAAIGRYVATQLMHPFRPPVRSPAGRILP